MTDRAGRILVTGTAGFIGYHVARRLIADGATVLGIDNLNAYYDPALKRARLAALAGSPGFRQEAVDLCEHDRIREAFAAFRPDAVIHLAAQAGVRHSLDDPHAYVASNVDGFLSILEACRHHPIRHLVYASSSSVYGANGKVPFSETDRVDRPVSLYAATKRANELMAETYGHLFGIRATGLRFFTVYGPWGRPDMAYWTFTKAIAEGREIEVFNEGRMRRDFTYVDDVVDAVARLVDVPPVAGDGAVPHAVYNVGNHVPVELERFIAVIADAVGKPARIVYRPMQPGDVVETCADIDRLAALVGYAPSTTIETGIPRFVAWFREYHSTR